MNQEEILALLTKLRPTLKDRYGVHRLGLFGSQARGDAGRDSDIDVVVEMTPNLYKRAALKAELETRFGRRVDVVRYRPGMNPILRARIEREARYV